MKEMDGDHPSVKSKELRNRTSSCLRKQQAQSGGLFDLVEARGQDQTTAKILRLGPFGPESRTQVLESAERHIGQTICRWSGFVAVLPPAELVPGEALEHS